MPQHEIVRFDLIPLGEVPFRFPKAKPAANPRGSKWDEVLRALEREYGKKAVRIIEGSSSKRKRLKSELNTMAKNRGFAVGLIDDDDGAAFYAWISRKAGRFSPPKL